MSFVLRLLLLFIILFLIEFYFIKKVQKIVRIFFPNLNEKRFKIIKTIGIFYFNLYPILGILYWAYILIAKTNPAPPESFFFDYFILYPFWFGIILIFQSIIYFLVIDFFKLILLPIYKKNKEKWISIESKFLLVIIILFTLYIPGRIIYDLNTIETRLVEYKKGNLPPKLNGFKIALISDIQADRYTDESRLKEFIENVNEADPDLVLIAGDIITGSPAYITQSSEYLGKINSKHGVYSCVGDHDNWAYRFDNERSIKEVTAALQEQGIAMVDNDKLAIDIDSATIGITFITNTYVERIPLKILDSLVNGSSNHDLKIFLTHQPRQYLINKAVEYNYDLFFAGHTHGGQITLVFPFIALGPTLIETSYVRGDFWFDNMLMIVTPGLGMSLAPVRYNSTPEVTIIKLTNA